MRSFLYVFSALAVIGLAYWAYHENYRTQAAIREVRALHKEIGAAHERLNVLEAEWAYLNRPDRLRELVKMNYERLNLLPMMPASFGRVDQVSFPLLQPGPTGEWSGAILANTAPDGEFP